MNFLKNKVGQMNKKITVFGQFYGKLFCQSKINANIWTKYEERTHISRLLFLFLLQAGKEIGSRI